MEKMFMKLVMTGIIFPATVISLCAQNKTGMHTLLSGKYNLVIPHSYDTQFYTMQSTLQQHAGDGSILGTDIYRLSLQCIPAKGPAKEDEYTCLSFTVQHNNNTPVAIPSLVNWKYLFSSTVNGRDSLGQVFGIDHSKFEKLMGDNGKLLPLENTYHVYNAFIDFHAMGFFAEKTRGDSGIQHLKQVGDSVVHLASFSKPPVNLGSGIAEGSYFQNGLVVLYFKGLGVIRKRNCAIIEYDSGKSSFYMLVRPSPTMDIPTSGSSHYWGDIYKDLQDGWIMRAILHELVVSETIVTATNKVHSVVERTIDIENVTRK
jgi:hypothetical protein